MVFAITEQASGVRAAYNTDLIQPFLLMRAPEQIPDWYLSPANYAFPDCLVAWVLNLLQIPLTFMPIAYGGLLLSGYSLAIAFIVQFATRFSLQAGVLLGAAIVAGIQAAAAAHGEALGSNMTLSLAAPFIHTGAALMGLFTLPAIGRLALPHSRSRGPVALLLVCSLLMSFSDFLYVLWYLLPGLAVWILARRLSRRAALIPEIAIVLATAAAGVVLAHIYGGASGVGTPDYGAVAQSLAAIAAQAIEKSDIMLLSDLGLTILMTVATARSLVSGWRRGGMSEAELAISLLTAAQLASLAVPIVGGQFVVPANARYSLPAFLLPAVWIALVMARQARRSAVERGFRIAVSIGVALALLVAGPWSVGAARALAAPSALAKCLIAAGLRDGVAEYWNAKALIFESNYSISIVQVDTKGSPYHWNYNGLWFTRSADGTRPVKPNFIVLDNLDKDALAARFGTPSSTRQCGGSTVWVYDHVLTR
jgi:hypothetical protein